MVVAQKGHGPHVNPFDVNACAHEFDALSQEFASGACRKERSTLQDLAFGARLLFGRWPTEEEIARLTSAPPGRGLEGLVDSLLTSPEFAARPISVSLEGWERAASS